MWTSFTTRKISILAIIIVYSFLVDTILNSYQSHWMTYFRIHIYTDIHIYIYIIQFDTILTHNSTDSEIIQTLN